jgi:hypothetical protein
MRSLLGKECRKLFSKMMDTEFQDYHQDKGQNVPQGWYVWTRRQSPNLFFHIILVIHDSSDEFTIEGSWSMEGMLPSDYAFNSDEFFSDPKGIRLGVLWNGEDSWWPLVLRPEEFERAVLYKDDPVEQCVLLVAPAVSDAAMKLKKHLVPAFKEVARLHEKRA